MTDVEFRNEFLTAAKSPVAAEADSPSGLVSGYLALQQATLRRAVEFGIGEQGLRDMRCKAAEAFMKRWMSLQFATIDLSFTAREWSLVVWREVGGNGFQVREASQRDVDRKSDMDPAFERLVGINRFFFINAELHALAFDKIEPDTRGFPIEFPASRKKGRLAARDWVRLSAMSPDGICLRHARIARWAMAYRLLAEAALMREGIDLPAELNESRHPIRTVSIFWAPKVEALTLTSEPPRPAGDPAIIMRMSGADYLLDFYETPDEAPIEHLIREFSEGRLNLGEKTA